MRKFRMVTFWISALILTGDLLLLSAKVGHLNQVLPIVRYWLPHIRIVSPDSWQQTLEQDMSDYLAKTG